jgi:hypothetical protein
MISGKAQRELQKKIDVALADESITYRVEKVIENATLEYNKMLEREPLACGAGLTAHIYGKLLAKGYIKKDPEPEEDE